MSVFAVVGANIGNGVVVLAGAGLGELVALSVEVGVVVEVDGEVGLVVAMVALAASAAPSGFLLGAGAPAAGIQSRSAPVPTHLPRLWDCLDCLDWARVEVAFGLVLKRSLDRVVGVVRAFCAAGIVF